MGYGAERAPATAIVDLLSPDARQQTAQLAPGGQLIGLNRDNRFGAAMTLPVVPVPVPVPPTGPAPPVAASPTPAPPVTPTAPPAATPRPAAGAAALPAPAASASAPRTRDAAFFEEQELRLRALKRLRDGGLITEDEYQQKRREILEKL